jgi:hypothetical protein
MGQQARKALASYPALPMLCDRSKRRHRTSRQSSLVRLARPRGRPSASTSDCGLVIRRSSIRWPDHCRKWSGRQSNSRTARRPLSSRQAPARGLLGSQRRAGSHLNRRGAEGKAHLLRSQIDPKLSSKHPTASGKVLGSSSQRRGPCREGTCDAGISSPRRRPAQY